MTVHNTILSLATDVCIVERRAPATFTDGIQTLGALAPITGSPVTACITRLKGRALAYVPEGYSASNTRRMRTLVQLEADDVVTFDGEPWRVIETDVVKGHGGQSYWAIIARDKVTP